jgi:DNA-binding transcriptional regulator GbsR (MarR family)
MVARVFACLVTTDSGTRTAAELVQQLRVSPASVSKAIGYLEGLGLIRRERDSRRRERYIIDDDLWNRTWRTDAQRHATWAETAQQGTDIFGATTPTGARLDQMGRFFARLANDMAGSPITAATFDDALTVAAALLYVHAPLTVDQLASALGWPSDRVTNALHAVEQYPEITGPVTLQHAESGMYTVATRLDWLSAPQRQALCQWPGSHDTVG